MQQQMSHARLGTAMRIIATLTLIAVFSSPSIVIAQFQGREEPEFDLRECAMNATHVLVVDRLGRLAEIWKGEAAVGDRIPIEKYFLRPGLPTWMETPCDQVFAGTRTLLPAGRIARYPQPAHLVSREVLDTTPATCGRTPLDEMNIKCWLPASHNRWFVCSMAYVDDFGMVRHDGLLRPVYSQDDECWIVPPSQVVQPSAR